jgi:hypothetical protein
MRHYADAPADANVDVQEMDSPIDPKQTIYNTIYKRERRQLIGLSQNVSSGKPVMDTFLICGKAVRPRHRCPVPSDHGRREPIFSAMKCTLPKEQNRIQSKSGKQQGKCDSEDCGRKTNDDEGGETRKW